MKDTLSHCGLAYLISRATTPELRAIIASGDLSGAQTVIDECTHTSSRYRHMVLDEVPGYADELLIDDYNRAGSLFRGEQSPVLAEAYRAELRNNFSALQGL